MPECELHPVEVLEPRGPFGAKETGEGPVSPTAPAIADAVWHATAFRATRLPITPERLLDGLEGRVQSKKGEEELGPSCRMG